MSEHDDDPNVCGLRRSTSSNGCLRRGLSNHDAGIERIKITRDPRDAFREKVLVTVRNALNRTKRRNIPENKSKKIGGANCLLFV
ncbi:hypothetical protein ACV229_30415 [Burkholderia sp. MR1-5-21]